MAENIVINFEANTQGLQSTIDLLEKLGQVDKKTADEFRKATNEFKAQDKALEGINQEVKKTGDEAVKASQKVQAANKQTTKSFSDLSNSIKGVAGAIGIAFGTAAIINFGKQAFNAFAEAELNARKLQTAVSVAGGLSGDFERLIKQSEELQKITIFSDDDIQAVQTLGLQFGLTAKQVEELTPILADFASATGQSIQEANEAIIRGLEGQGRGLKLYGIEVDATASKAENLSSITKQLNDNFKGQAEIIAGTTAGQIKVLGNAYDELKESIGGALNESIEFVSQLFLASFDPAKLAVIKGNEELQKINKAQAERDKVFQATYAKAIEKETLTQLELRNEKTLALLKKATEDNNKERVRDLTLARNVITQEIKERQRLLSLNKKDAPEIKADEAIVKSKENLGKDIVKIYDKVQYKSKQVTDEEIANANKEYQEKTGYSLAYQQELSDRGDEELKKNEALSEKKIELAAATANEIFNISQALFNANIQNLETEQDAILKQYDDQLAALEETRDKERITEARFNNEKKELIRQREKFELDSQKKINEEKRKADIANRAQKVFQITIETARAIAESSPNPVLIALAAALGAAQLATVLATPLPKYKKGTLSVGGIDTGQDTQLAMLRPGEAVIPTETNKAYHPAIKAIYEGRISAKDMNSFVSMKLKGGDIKNSFALDYDLLAKKLGNEMAWQLRGSNNVNIKNVQDFAKALNSGYDFRRMI